MRDIEAAFKELQDNEDIRLLRSSRSHLMNILNHARCRICDDHIDGKEFGIVDLEGDSDIGHMSCILLQEKHG
jgi:hypothetical protein